MGVDVVSLFSREGCKTSSASGISASVKFVAYGITTIFAVIGIVTCVALAAIYYRMDFFGRLISDRLLANAAISTRGTMPPTGGQVPYSSADVQIVGGRGEGLSCSLPSQVARRAFPPQKGRASIELEMRQACAMHDYCYRHGAATYGYTQADCDFILQEQAFQLCYFIERAREAEQPDNAKSKCIRDAQLVTLGVRVGGSDSFRSISPSIHALSVGLEEKPGVDGPASTYFEYDPYPVRSQSYTIFRIADAPNLDEKLTGRKRVYAFSMRPSGVFLSVAMTSGQMWQKAILPGDPAYLVTPPLVVQTRHAGRSEDWFVWWQRRSLGETGGRLLGIAPGRATINDWRCLYFVGMPGSMRDNYTSCNSKEDALFVAEIGLKDAGDALISEIMPSSVGQVTKDILRLSAMQTQSCASDGSNGLCFLDIAINISSDAREQPQKPLPFADEFAPKFLGRPQFEADPYRNFAQDPIILNPDGGPEPVIIWSRRDTDFGTVAGLRRLGIDRSKVASGYDQAASRGFLNIDQLSELNEPSFIVERKSTSPLLVSVVPEGDKSSYFRLSQWRLPPLSRQGVIRHSPRVDPEPPKCASRIENTWLARPPIVMPVGKGITAMRLSRAIGPEQEDARHWLQIGYFLISNDGGCTELQELPPVPLEDLLPASTDDVRKANRQRVEILRRTPVLAADMDGDAQIEILLPGSRVNKTIEIARIDKDFRIIPLPMEK